MEKIISATKAYVEQYMSHYDASHDYSHIQRVLHLAKTIQSRETALQPEVLIDSDIVTLAALLHDVGDRKYVKEGQDAKTMVLEWLLSVSCPKATAEKVQLVCTNISYSNESKNTEAVAALCAQYPELRIVQDADRLDAIGATGIARMFVYTGAKQSERGLSTEHFYQKLLRLETMMKTDTGKALARQRTERMEEYLRWYEEEMEGVQVMLRSEKADENV